MRHKTDAPVIRIEKFMRKKTSSIRTSALPVSAMHLTGSYRTNWRHPFAELTLHTLAVNLHATIVSEIWSLFALFAGQSLSRRDWNGSRVLANAWTSSNEECNVNDHKPLVLLSEALAPEVILSRLISLTYAQPHLRISTLARLIDGAVKALKHLLTWFENRNYAKIKRNKKIKDTKQNDDNRAPFTEQSIYCRISHFEIDSQTTKNGMSEAAIGVLSGGHFLDLNFCK